MTEERLQQLLNGFDRARILVVGDFFLDKYLVFDSRLTETSLETGLDAYQVVGKRLFPGAAGTVTSNLRALDAGAVTAMGLVGRDGEGFELIAGLQASGVATDQLVQTDECFTPTYTKPMLLESGSERELNRIDIKNRKPCPPEVERRIRASLREMAPGVDAVIVADQVQERNCGVVTDAVRAELSALARAHPKVAFIADSRTRIGEFAGLSIKPNRWEAWRAGHGAEPGALAAEDVLPIGQEFQRRSGRPIFITLAEDGILAFGAEGVSYAPTLRQTGPIDICGAGDSVMAGIALALCCGADSTEAATVGNLVASITVQQIGVTGTASRWQVLERFRCCREQFAARPR